MADLPLCPSTPRLQSSPSCQNLTRWSVVWKGIILLWKERILHSCENDRNRSHITLQCSWCLRWSHWEKRPWVFPARPLLISTVCPKCRREQALWLLSGAECGRDLVGFCTFMDKFLIDFFVIEVNIVYFWVVSRFTNVKTQRGFTTQESIMEGGQRRIVHFGSDKLFCKY